MGRSNSGSCIARVTAAFERAYTPQDLFSPGSVEETLRQEVLRGEDDDGDVRRVKAVINEMLSAIRKRTIPKDISDGLAELYKKTKSLSKMRFTSGRPRKKNNNGLKKPKRTPINLFHNFTDT